MNFMPIWIYCKIKCYRLSLNETYGVMLAHAKKNIYWRIIKRNTCIMTIRILKGKTHNDFPKNHALITVINHNELIKRQRVDLSLIVQHEKILKTESTKPIF